MRSFQQKGGWGSIMHSRPVLVLLGILVLIFAWGVIGFARKMEATRENREIAENKVAELTKEKEKLSGDIAKLNTPEGVEENIRDKFGLAKEGEGMIVVVEEKKSPMEANVEDSGFFSSLMFWKSWFK